MKPETKPHASADASRFREATVYWGMEEPRRVAGLLDARTQVLPSERALTRTPAGVWATWYTVLAP